MYVPLGNQELITTVVTGLGDADPDNDTVVLSTLVGYTNGGPVLSAGRHTRHGRHGYLRRPHRRLSPDSNFDASGNLIVPDAADATDNTKLIPLVVTSGNGVDEIRTRVEQVNRAAELLKKARDENVGLNQAIYDEAYRRAQAEADYYNAHWAKVLADTTDVRTDDQKNSEHADYEANPITIARRNAEYTTESNKRFTAEQDAESSGSGPRSGDRTRSVAVQLSAIVLRAVGLQAYGSVGCRQQGGGECLRRWRNAGQVPDGCGSGSAEGAGRSANGTVRILRSVRQ